MESRSLVLVFADTLFRLSVFLSALGVAGSIARTVLRPCFLCYDLHWVDGQDYCCHRCIDERMML